MDKFKVIVVDDEASVLEVVKAILETEGIDIFTTTSSLTALEQIRRGSYDLIISDLKMPEMDGLQLFEKVRETGIDSLSHHHHRFRHHSIRGRGDPPRRLRLHTQALHARRGAHPREEGS